MFSNCGAGEDSLGQQEVKPVNPKRNQPWNSLEGLMLKLKLQYFGHLMWRADSLEKTLVLGKSEYGRRMGQPRMRWLDSIINSMDMSLSSGRWWRTGKPGVLQFMGTQRVEHNSDWTKNSTFLHTLFFTIIMKYSQYFLVGKNEKIEANKQTKT